MAAALLNSVLQLAQKRIVLIEDHDELRVQLHEALVLAGYEVWSAETGGKGVELIRDYRPDLVITDLNTPGKNGFDALIELRDEFRAIKSLVISTGGAFGEMDSLNLAKMLGATEVLRKPFSIIQLFGRVGRLIGPARVAAELPQHSQAARSAPNPLKLKL
jgi:DNA-binding response OmpR family regulator